MRWLVRLATKLGLIPADGPRSAREIAELLTMALGIGANTAVFSLFNAAFIAMSGMTGEGPGE